MNERRLTASRSHVRRNINETGANLRFVRSPSCFSISSFRYLFTPLQEIPLSDSAKRPGQNVIAVGLFLNKQHLQLGSLSLLSNSSLVYESFMDLLSVTLR